MKTLHTCLLLVFDGLELSEGFHKVRAEAIRVVGLGSVPKIELPAAPTVVKTVKFRATNVSVLTLFDLIAAASVSTLEWRFEGSRIVLIDEAKIREEDRLHRIAMERARRQQARGGGGGDADPFAPSGWNSRPVRPQVPKPNAPRFHTEAYDHFGDNPFFSPEREPLSTFSADVDTASYSNVRRLIQNGGPNRGSC